ncbi:MAG TPA: Lrp/AsnC family transcriptional regulator [Zoogloea sp.]|uniref:Lrp/AsnC family transcriptional regulator n=1 Tax=Zoogloea sp. TaxID=49181 RepID=UPI002C4CD81E|nr:Lrp/AsnC family transcriptional regulator [Zoogloea sp.]HMV19379.1 Lrp/AsnC family transcriptional regulator [Rhodocyclaceae bacterium]HMV64466.1 Lrp/AsnC family transcriptional regulator [Rhodocyclaceae bacterium]HMW51713.1 Lrp/AsnC family transcriptional regulator [Rhodocyclaceae bacterium]HMY49697.1 Lrp/AsnC family transcriptional regulator [Rhodocyclaceae bacterium]HMZ76117.1 Lrp/AsnC family transcriptional regulator [Rhodocyclaceae bacterium]
MILSGHGLDEVDRTVLRLLQGDGRMSNARLAETLSLSETPCWRRLRRLEAEGFIEGYQARLSRRKLGYGVLAFVQVTLGDHAGEAPLQFERQVAGLPQILSCHNVTGDCDYLLQVVAEDLDAYGLFVRDRLRTLPGVTAIRSSLSLREVKASSALPV